jgi:hypothetical protein
LDLTGHIEAFHIEGTPDHGPPGYSKYSNKLAKKLENILKGYIHPN